MTSIAKRVDEHVGERIRRRRTQLGLTQHQLAQALGISYQQVQKYETGANRISAGRLFEMALHLQISIAFFFEGLEPSSPSVPMEHGGRQRTVIDVVRNFASIGSPDVRAAVAGLIRTLAGHMDDAAATGDAPAEAAPERTTTAAA